uniref:Uncharacterized protein n=1 Tax=Arundo donax TaxID=35708 RepID=A0A0A9BXY9_ARUDO
MVIMGTTTTSSSSSLVSTLTTKTSYGPAWLTCALGSDMASDAGAFLIGAVWFKEGREHGAATAEAVQWSE